MFRYNKERTGAVTAPGNDVLGKYRPHPIWIFPYPLGDSDPVDNDSTNFDHPNFEATGAWVDSSTLPEGARGLNPYGTDYLRIKAAATATATAIWVFKWASTVPDTPADFVIQLWFPSQTDDELHVRDAQYTVQIGNPSTNSWTTIGTYELDQTAGGSWVTLGRRTFRVDHPRTQAIRVILTNISSERNSSGEVVDAYVVADAARLVQDAGTVQSSPVASEQYNLVLTCIAKNMPLEGYNAYGSTNIGVVYGLGTEVDSGIPGVADDRGFPKWRFPEEDHNWILRGISSTPTITTYSGNEVAVVPAGDGTVYVISTEDGKLVWRGPGYFLDDPTSTTDGSNPWEKPTNAVGYLQFDSSAKTCLHAKTVPAGDPNLTKSVATWTTNINQKGTYDIYAYIPPSSGSVYYSYQARYEVKVNGQVRVRVTVNQSSGPQWVRLAEKVAVNNGDTVTVELTNERPSAGGGPPVPLGANTSSTPISLDDLYVVADAVKIVPAGIGSFEYSSPIVDGSRNIYVGSTGGRVYKLRIGDPDPVWIFPDPNDTSSPHPIGAVYASPTFGDIPKVDPETGMTVQVPHIFVGSSDGHVYAINADTGKQTWVYPSKTVPNGETPLVLPQISSTIALGDHLYVALGAWNWSGYSFNPEGRVLMLNKNTGTEAGWYPATDQPSKGSFLYSSPLVMDIEGSEHIFVASTDGNLYGFTSNGTDLWGSGTPSVGKSYSSPAGTICAELVQKDASAPLLTNVPVAFVGNEYGRINRVILNATNPVVDWWWDLYGSARSSPAIFNERIYIGDMAGFTWAFSTREPGGGGEQWNTELGPEPPMAGSDPTGDSNQIGRPAKPEVDVFRKTEFEAFLAAAKVSRDNNQPIDSRFDNLHNEARAEKESLPSGQPFIHEWGEDIYIIVWNLVDPNEDKDGNKLKRPGEDGFKTLKQHGSGHKVSITVKPVVEGKDADAVHSTTLDNNRTDYYVNKDGYAVFYTTYVYTLDTSAPGRPQTPCDNLRISVMEIPSSSLTPKHPSSEEVYVLEHPLSNNKPQRFQINNPIGLVIRNRNGTPIAEIGVNAGSTSGTATTSRRHQLAGVNGNPSVPYAWGGWGSHGTSTTPRDVEVYDRSLLRAVKRRLDRFRFEVRDLLWMGGPSQVVAMLPWDVPPADARLNTPNISDDYPDIPARQLTAPMRHHGQDPTVEMTHLHSSVPPAPNGDTSQVTEPWPIRQADDIPDVAEIKVSVPRFQPANMLPAGSTGEDTLARSTGYRSTIYAYIDSNGNGRFDRPASLGMVDPVQKDTKAEAYREFQFGIHVPADRRIRVEETVVDIGEVPHGFGFVPTPGSGEPVAFEPTLADNIRKFDPWLKPFTAYNIGNTNLLNLRLAVAAPGLISDTVQDPTRGPNPTQSGPFGFFIPGASTVVQPNQRDPNSCVISSLDPLFWDDTPSPALMPNIPRTFHKARVGESEPLLTVPDLPERLYPNYPEFNAEESKPRIGVAVPLGQPVGEYYGQVTLYEDGLGVIPGQFDSGTESIGNPVITVKVRVTEAKMTDGFIQGALPQVDAGPAARKVVGDTTPVAFRDPATAQMHMIWSSSRWLPASTNSDPTATDPWYLFITTLEPTSGGPGGWKFPAGNPATWWLPTNTDPSGVPGGPFPPPDSVGSLFPEFTDIKPGSVRFTSPSVAVDPVNMESWLFFAGQAEAVESSGGSPLGSKGKNIASKVFYVKMANGSPQGTIATSTHDYTMPKLGVRGAVSRMSSIPSSAGGAPQLWAFWYGGAGDRWRIYYTMNNRPNDPHSWRMQAVLPVPDGLTSAAEPSPVFRWWNGTTGDTFDVVYSGYSVFHRNSDVYLSKYLPADKPDPLKQGADWPVKMVVLPSRGYLNPTDPQSDTPGEIMTPDSTRAIYSSRDVDWDATRVVDSAAGRSSFSVYYVPDRNNPNRRFKLNVGKYVKDPNTGALIFDFSNSSVPELAALRAVVINPVAGTVKFLRAPSPDAMVIAEYNPRAYRLSSIDKVADLAPDVSPFAFIDSYPNPRFSPGQGNPFFDPNGSNNPSPAPPTDRYWVFWRRPGIDKPGTGIHYKTFRYMVDLNHQVAVDLFNKPRVDSVEGLTKALTSPVEVDWVKNRLYFTADDALILDQTSPVPRMKANKVRVTYVADDGETYTEDHVVRFAEDDISKSGSGTYTFGTVTSVMVNEGQVSAFKDPWSNKVYVFWTSTRDGGTDIFYEAISPKFYAPTFP
jgi:outer membrane protein assembly factor BamB